MGRGDTYQRRENGKETERELWKQVRKGRRGMVKEGESRGEKERYRGEIKETRGLRSWIVDRCSWIVEGEDSSGSVDM